MDLCGFAGNLQHHGGEAELGTGLREELSNPGFLQCGRTGPRFTARRREPAGLQDLGGLSGTGRYVRMYGTVRATTYGYSLWEFEIYGTVPAPINHRARACGDRRPDHPGRQNAAGHQFRHDADAPPQLLAYSLSSLPAGASIDTNSGLFTWRPAIAQSPSTQTVAVVVSDNGSPIMTATQSFKVTVTRPVTPALNAVSLSNGRFGFWINGDTGPDYTILASTNLTSWIPVFTTNSPPLPCFWADPNSAAYPLRFYRTVLGP